jgi:hypothetical protein
MKKIAIAAILAFGLGALDVASSGSANARGTRVVVAPVAYGYGYTYPAYPKKWNAARYIACRNRVFPERAYGAAYLFAVDRCYVGAPW